MVNQCGRTIYHTSEKYSAMSPLHAVKTTVNKNNRKRNLRYHSHEIPVHLTPETRGVILVDHMVESRSNTQPRMTYQDLAYGLTQQTGPRNIYSTLSCHIISQHNIIHDQSSSHNALYPCLRRGWTTTGKTRLSAQPDRPS